MLTACGRRHCQLRRASPPLLLLSSHAMAVPVPIKAVETTPVVDTPQLPLHEILHHSELTSPFPLPCPILTTTPSDIKSSLLLLNKSVTLLEPRFTTKAIRNLPALRKVIKEADLKDGGGVKALGEVLRADLKLGESLLPHLRDWHERASARGTREGVEAMTKLSRSTRWCIEGTTADACAVI